MVPPMAGEPNVLVVPVFGTWRKKSLASTVDGGPLFVSAAQDPAAEDAPASVDIVVTFGDLAPSTGRRGDVVFNLFGDRVPFAAPPRHIFLKSCLDCS